MAAGRAQNEAGGFLPSRLPSPPVSVSSLSHTLLPQPRSQALKAGGKKEAAVRGYMEKHLLQISGRYQRRFQDDGQLEQDSDKTGEGSGAYQNFTDIATDLNTLIDVIWVSGTRMSIVSLSHILIGHPSDIHSAALQVPFLFNIALAVTDYMASFPFSPRATLLLFGKLDYAFYSLLDGRDRVTGQPLPGFESGQRITMTEKVRLQGIVERTRVQIVDVARTHDFEDEAASDLGGSTTADESDAGIFASRGDQDGDDLDLDVAKVYEKTLAKLADAQEAFGL